MKLGYPAATIAQVDFATRRSVRCGYMVRPLDKNQRQSLAEKLMELGNLTFAGLVVGQAFSSQFQATHALLGLVLFVILYMLAIRYMRGGGDT